MKGESEIERIRSFQAHVDEGAAESVREWAFGKALLSPGIPRVRDGNYCRVDASGGASADEIAGAATDVASGAEVAYVTIVAEEDEANRLRDGLEELGFKADDLVILILRGRPDRPSIDVGDATLEDVAGSRRELNLEFAPGDVDLAEQLDVIDERFKATIGGRWFAIRDGAQILSRCWLIEANRMAQIEDVATTAAARGRGLASAVVTAAAIAALDAGNEVVFIVAEADGDAQRLYRKIGFEPLGLSTRFVRDLTSS